jgi:hypothetical protein
VISRIPMSSFVTSNLAFHSPTPKSCKRAEHMIKNQPSSKSLIANILPLSPLDLRIWRGFPANVMIPIDRGGWGRGRNNQRQANSLTNLINGNC